MTDTIFIISLHTGYLNPSYAHHKLGKLEEAKNYLLRKHNSTSRDTTQR